MRAAMGPRDSVMLLGFGRRLWLACDYTATVPPLMAGLTAFEKRRLDGMPELQGERKRRGGSAIFDAVYATAKEKLTPYSGERKAPAVVQRRRR